ncbi:MAG: hypothetical protein HY547_05590, partial [Elusimicrobia bacterium]|nr:hypothetical protein [Elusimicrobiota bacterium]
MIRIFIPGPWARGLAVVLTASAFGSVTVPLAALHYFSSTTIRGSAGGADYGNDITLDAGGNIFVAGSINETSGGANVWVGKFSPSLTLTASANLDGTGGASDSGNGIVVSTNGSVFVIGSVNQSSGGDDIWIGKYDSSLALISSVTLNGPANSTDIGYGITMDTSGILYATGYITDVTGGANIWAAKFNDALAFISSAVIAGSGGGTDRGYAITVDRSSNVYVAGYVFETSGSENLWVGKLNTSLQLQQSNAMNGSASGADAGQDVVVDRNGRVFVIGSLNEIAGNINIWMARLNSSLSIEQSTSVTGTAGTTDEGYGLALDDTGNPFAAGYLHDLAGDQNLWAGFLNPDLLPQTTATINGSGNTTDMAYDIAIDSRHYVYITGFMDETLGGRNIFVSKHDFLTVSSDNITALSLGASSIAWAWSGQGLHRDGFRVISSTQGILSGNITSTSWTETNLATNTYYSRQIAAYNAWAASTSTAISTYTLAAAP